MALSAAEKQRRYRQRRDADPERRQKHKQKMKEKYIDDLKTGKRKLIGSLTERGKRSLRKKWREEKEKYRKQNKQKQTEIVSPPCTPIVNFVSTPGSSSQSSKDSTKRKRAIARCYRTIAEKNAEIRLLKRKVQSYRKRLQRSSKEKTTTDTPKKMTKRTMKMSKKGVRQTLLFHHTLLTQLKEDKKKGEKYIAKLLSGNILKKYKIKTKLQKEIGAWNKQKERKISGSLSSRLRKQIVDFYERDDISRIVPGVKSTVTKRGLKKQKRLLCDSLIHLHMKYLSENERFRISYSVFCRLRPFWVVIPTEKDRNTCLCKVCENTKFLVEAMHKNNLLDTTDIYKVISSIVCNTENKDCMYRTCKTCKNQSCIKGSKSRTRKTNTSWTQWQTVKENRTFKSGETKEITIVKKIQEHGDLQQLKSTTDLHLAHITKHFFNIKNQFQYYRTTKSNLGLNECLIHVDFSENYVGKTSSEIQSMHFGASQPQITMHTGIYYTKEKFQSFCTVSDSLEHGPSAIWAYMEPVLSSIKETHPHIDFIHFFSDGPVTQYRQKKNFFLLSTVIYNLGYTGASWNFFESGHGKGSPDAIGGSLKRSADRLVLYGRDITSAEQFKHELESVDTNVKLFSVTREAVLQAEEKLDIVKQQLKAVPRTMAIHQVQTYSQKTLLVREVSCSCKYGAECNCHKFSDFKFELENCLKRKRKDLMSNLQKSKIKASKNKSEDLKKSENGAAKKKRPDSIQDRKNGNNFDQYLHELQKCTSFEEIQLKCQGFQLPSIKGSCRNIVECRSTVDQSALDMLPSDVPGSIMFPVVVRADGDCLPSSGSVFAFGSCDRVSEMRVRIIEEMASHIDSYLDNTYLNSGYGETGKEEDLKKTFALYSDEYLPGVVLTDNIISTIYKNEVLKITKPKSYMGVWQLFCLASVLKMPIFSAYPMLGNPIVRKHLHRLIQPRQSTCNKDRDNVAVIMWSTTRTDMVSSHWVPNHFAPVLPIDNEQPVTLLTSSTQDIALDVDVLTSDLDVQMYINYEELGRGNSGSIENHGVRQECGAIENQGVRQAGGAIENQGARQEGDAMENHGVGQESGAMENHGVGQECGAMENHGVRQDGGATENQGVRQEGSAMENHGVGQEGGAMVNHGVGQEGGAMVNHGVGQEGGAMVNHGVGQEVGAIVNHGVRQEGDAIENQGVRQEGGAVENQGVRQVGGATENHGVGQEGGAMENHGVRQEVGAIENQGVRQEGGAIENHGVRQEGDAIENQGVRQEGGANENQGVRQEGDAMENHGVGQVDSATGNHGVGQECGAMENHGVRQEGGAIENQGVRQQGDAMEDHRVRQKDGDKEVLGVWQKGGDMMEEHGARRVLEDQGVRQEAIRQDHNIEINGHLQRNVGEFVIVLYQGEPFPGIIRKDNKIRRELFVECMKKEMEGTDVFFSWPRRKDQCWYEYNNVVTSIQPPVKVTGSLYKIISWQEIISYSR